MCTQPCVFSINKKKISMWRYVVGSLVGIVESLFVFGGQKWEELVSEWDAIYLACGLRFGDIARCHSRCH
jgi:hypothetical protein